MSIGAANPITDPQSWDTCRVAGIVCPGYCVLSEPKRPYEWDVKAGNATGGATTTLKGKPPAKFSVTFYLWEESHFTAWDSFLPLFKYDPTKKTVKAVDFYHPSTADIDIHSVVAESLGAIRHEGDGLYSRTIDLLEYFPAPKTPVIATPTSSDINTQPGTPADPAVVAAQNSLDKALADAKALGPL